MLERLFPKQIDNNYPGLWTGAVLFAALMLVKGVQGFESAFNTRNVMTTADGIALDGFSPAALDLVTTTFALLGLYVMVLPTIGLVVLARYRAMIPLIYLLFLILQVSARVLSAMHPIARAPGTPIGFTVNVVILVLTVIGLALSLQKRRSAA